MKISRAFTLIVTVCVVVFFLVILKSRQRASKFSVGADLPPGKVAPQLVTSWDGALLLAPDGSLWGWGGTDLQLDGLFEKPTLTVLPRRIGSDSDWREIAVSHEHTLALKTDGSLWGWGRNYLGQIAQPYTTNRFAKPTRIGTDTDWAHVRTGGAHALALKRDDSLWAWGLNAQGAVGDGTTNNRFTPTLIGIDRDWKAIVSGPFSSYALKKNGTISAWGWDPTMGANSNGLSPRQIDPGTNWVAISAGGFSLMALKSDGTLWIRGQDALRVAPADVPNSTGTFTQIGQDKDWRIAYCGNGYFTARKRDSTWWGCGDNYAGQLGIGDRGGTVASPRRLPFEFEPWAFASDYGHSILLTKDGTIWTWGVRIGAPKPAESFKKLKGVLNDLTTFPGRKPAFRIEDYQTDSTPQRLWQLPSQDQP